jgi:hypothetical protein
VRRGDQDALTLGHGSGDDQRGRAHSACGAACTAGLDLPRNFPLTWVIADRLAEDFTADRR